MAECVRSEHLRPLRTRSAATLAHFGNFHLTSELGYDSLLRWLALTFCRWGAPGCWDGETERGGCATSEPDGPTNRFHAKSQSTRRSQRTANTSTLRFFAP